jgi:asparaginyl-tRNA synthetase
MIAKNAQYPEITFADAKKLLKDGKYFKKVYDGVESITSEGEQILIKEFGGIVWITHPHPISVPFYQAYDGNQALCGDLLFGIGETVGAGERHENCEEVKRALELHKIDFSLYDWYLEMKRKYPLKTSGFGLGIERYILWLLNHDDIRDVCLLSRLKGEDSYL